MSLCQCLTQCICVNVLLLQFDIIKLFICIGKIVTIKMFSCIHELSPYHYQLSSCHHQLSSWYILTCILDIYLDTISLNNYNQIDYALDLSPLNLTCCSQGQSRNKKLALSQSTRSPSGFHYFSKSWFSYMVTAVVCLSSKALQAAPLDRSSWFFLQKMSSGHATMQNFFFWKSDEGQGQGHHFCENSDNGP